MDHYVDNLSGHISAGSNKAIKRMPIGLVVIDADDHIEWINQYMSEHLETNVISEPVNEVFRIFLSNLKSTRNRNRTWSVPLSCTLFCRRALFIFLRYYRRGTYK